MQFVPPECGSFHLIANLTETEWLKFFEDVAASSERAFIGFAKYKFESRIDLVLRVIEMVDIASSPNCEWKSEIMWCVTSRDLVKDFDLLITVVIRCSVQTLICVCVANYSIVTVVFHSIRKQPQGLHLKIFGAGRFYSQKISVPSVLRENVVLSCCIIKQTKNETIETKKAMKSFYSTQNFLKFWQLVTHESMTTCPFSHRYRVSLRCLIFLQTLHGFVGSSFLAPMGKRPTGDSCSKGSSSGCPPTTAHNPISSGVNFNRVS